MKFEFHQNVRRTAVPAGFGGRQLQFGFILTDCTNSIGRAGENRLSDLFVDIKLETSHLMTSFCWHHVSDIMLLTSCWWHHIVDIMLVTSYCMTSYSMGSIQWILAHESRMIFHGGHPRTVRAGLGSLRRTPVWHDIFIMVKLKNGFQKSFLDWFIWYDSYDMIHMIGSHDRFTW